MARPTDRVPEENTRIRRLQSEQNDFLDFIASGSVIQVDAEGGLVLILATNSGLENVAGELLLDLGANSGLVLTTNELFINLVTAGGLSLVGNELGLDTNVAFWRKVTVAFGAFSAAALTVDIELLSLPAAGIIEMVKIKHSTAFAGTGITAMTVSVGITADLVKYAPAFDVFQAVGDTVFVVHFLPDTEDHAAATSIRVAATSVGANLDQLSGGSVDIWVKYGVAV